MMQATARILGWDVKARIMGVEAGGCDDALLNPKTEIEPQIAQITQMMKRM
jgi:hypothetical protein